jgi:hypothetical protein
MKIDEVETYCELALTGIHHYLCKLKYFRMCSYICYSRNLNEVHSHMTVVPSHILDKSGDNNLRTERVLDKRIRDNMSG